MVVSSSSLMPVRVVAQRVEAALAEAVRALVEVQAEEVRALAEMRAAGARLVEALRRPAVRQAVGAQAVTARAEAPRVEALEARPVAQALERAPSFPMLARSCDASSRSAAVGVRALRLRCWSRCSA